MALLRATPSGSPEVYLEEPRLSDPGLGVRRYGRTYVRTYVRTYEGGLSSCAYRQTQQTSENKDLSKSADGSVRQGLTEDRALPAPGIGPTTALAASQTPPWNPDPAKTATEPAAEESEAQ